MRTIVRAAIILGALILASCALNHPTITQLTSDGSWFMVAHKQWFETTVGRQKIVVPVGFITDLASIPRVLWWWESPHEGTLGPAIIHDFLYWEQSCTKDEADAVMYLGLLAVGFSSPKSYAIYLGVRTSAAQDAWDNNRKARDRGETRFFTVDYATRLQDSPIDPKATLVSLKAKAAENQGLYNLQSPNSTVKTACEAALKEYNTM